MEKLTDKTMINKIANELCSAYRGIALKEADKYAKKADRSFAKVIMGFIRTNDEKKGGRP